MIVNIGDPLYRPFPKGKPFQSSAKPEAMLGLTPQLVIAGNAVRGTVLLSAPAPEGGTVVSLKSELPQIVSVPETVVVPGAAVSALFPIATHAVNETTVARVSIAAGEMRRSNTLVVEPYLRPLILSATKVSGGTLVQGTILLSQRAAEETVTMKLSSDHAAVVSMPAEVQVPAGANRTTFRIATSGVAAETEVAISVVAHGCTRAAILRITP